MGDGTLEKIRLAQQGDAKATAMLLREHYPFLYKYLIKATMDPSLAEELAQDTMVRCMEKMGSYNGSSAFSSWLITIASRLYIDRKRRWKRELKWQKEQAQEQGSRSIRWRFESRNMEWSEVLDALSRLSTAHRMAVLLKHYYGYGYDEIGQMLQIPSGTAKSRVAAGLNQLRKELEEDEV
ncbi:RNA polymerase sigma factor SigY [Paenibacillus sp. FSL H8-0259]|uniref:RNA polymerase sigma factor SigY n=1 Tax=Paenibacillus sp. FSL H8-0259 TaxID=1920423 RepID=UPI00096BEDB7|nr:RNA polymerase sigma factor SigY [Paenibacillus sp. FSL H8-0259]OMF21516.1 RNA polymerase sigma factor SigY [Paenibacillus sp. FSL H8-0259]